MKQYLKDTGSWCGNGIGRKFQQITLLLPAQLRQLFARVRQLIAQVAGAVAQVRQLIAQDLIVTAQAFATIK